ncbi:MULTISPECIES: putative lipid II flippase FtsW [Arthrobacter]|uniref:Probable peptidoglycan glycosyltransferase FtsW n=1 Tax=Arthrobacter terricola TaxID=2547396 RepID=A0A4R5K8V1_9MICC|nr:MULTISPECIES: putative lipid II flippase FtsW [Arthrobacter]MBT8159361.1 putative lipid II flippase FtsW [Arthrobacter sp. GN70]TDF91389.1 putative lipid II flippase FtsW [Arthrobacter terricola]
MVSTPTRTGPGKSRSGDAATVGRAAGNAQPRKLISRLRSGVSGFWSTLEGSGKSRSNSTYYLVLGASLALTAIGIIMVLSASSVESIAAGESPYSLAAKQGMFAGLGIVMMLVLSRINVVWLKRFAWPAVILAVALLLLVLVIGKRVLGNQNWIEVGGFTFQPSEYAKFALVLWMATVLSVKAKLLDKWMHALVPIVPVAAVIITLIVLGHDLGTSLVVMLIMAAGLFFGGVNLKLFASAGGVAAAAALVLALTSGNRMCRITAWMGQGCTGASDIGFQSEQGMSALASGGWLGVGLGQSRQKYQWIPEAHNDFIFAVIGEELGLVGTLVVLVLFALLAVAIYRIVSQQEDLFARVLGGSIMAWMLGQAAINMAMVAGLLPVIGVPLPFISYGGSALVMSLCGVGVVLSLARAQMVPAKSSKPRRWPAIFARKRT